MKNKNKFWALFLSLTMCSVSFVACSDDDSTTDEVVDEDQDDEDAVDGGDGGPGGGGPGGGGDDGVDIPEDDGETVSELHAAFAEFNSDAVEVYISDDMTDYVITATGRPNHKTTYYPPEHPLYEFEDVRHTGGDQDGDGIQQEDEKTRIFDDQDYTSTIIVDATPNFSGVDIETEINIIGVAVSGGYIFNQLEGPQELNPGTAEGLDYTGGHIGPSVYHYHLEPHAFSSDDSNLIGILIDGVFIYGRKCTSTGTYPNDLDEVGGHTHVTEHSGGEEEYHYHMLNEPFFDGTDDYLIFEGPYKGF